MPGVQARDNRLFVDTVLYRYRAIATRYDKTARSYATAPTNTRMATWQQKQAAHWPHA